MYKIQIDIDGSLSGELGKIVAWGIQLSGANVYEISFPYSPERYNYTPLEDGGFNADGFEEIPQPLPVDDV
jgi:hypothetical protein